MKVDPEKRELGRAPQLTTEDGSFRFFKPKESATKRTDADEVILD